MSAPPAACLGCGCLCDDIAVTVRNGRVAAAVNACALGLRWFEADWPDAVRVEGRPATLEAAIDATVRLLRQAPTGTLVYVAPGLSCEAAREAVGLADELGARLDSVTSDTARAGILAVQAKGDAEATLGELKNRADAVVFWAVDPGDRYPRYASRYAVEPVGLHVAAGRAGRTVVAVDVGEATGPADVDVRLRLAPGNELGAISVMRASVLGRALGELAAPFDEAAALAARLAASRYVALVHDGEPGRATPAAGRAEAMIALAHALNGTTRAAVSRLRAGGNRSGIDAVLTWQTGYPFAVDFGRGHPRYDSEETAARLLAEGRIGTILIVGAAADVPPLVARGLSGLAVAVIGPGASRAPGVPAVAIDTAVAGLHESGTAFRMDGVSLPLRSILPGPPEAAGLIHRLRRLVSAPRPAASPTASA
jgi:formylmethanofuran dehydrogenase subunit B